MTLKLAIYGDSYAKTYKGLRIDTPDECWATHTVLTTNYSITNYSLSIQNDFYSQYQAFIETQKNYDQIVFIITESTRFSFKYKKLNIAVTGAPDEEAMIDNILKANASLNVDEYLDVYKSMFNFKLYAQHKFVFDAAQAKLYENIMNIRPDTVAMPAFENEFLDDKFNNFNLGYVSRLERIGMGMDKINDDNIIIDVRHAHMTRENNQIFADYIIRRLKNESVSISIDDFVQPGPELKSTYFKERKSEKISGSI